MPKIKAKIFNIPLDINYEVGDEEKLKGLIKNLDKRLEKYNNLISKVSNTKILLLAALAIEDELLEQKKINLSKKTSEQKDESNKVNIENLSTEIIKLNDKINILENEKIKKKQDELLIIKNLDQLNVEIEKMFNTLLVKYDE